MNRLESAGKTVQRIERGAAVEVNKATGDESRISAREPERSYSFPEIGTLASRIHTERSAAKKRAANRRIRKTKLSFDDGDTALTEQSSSTGIRTGMLISPLGRAAREASHAIRDEIRDSDNTGVQSAYFTERTATDAVRYAGHSSTRNKLKTQRAALRSEREHVKPSARQFYGRSRRETPNARSAGKKSLQKRRIKRNYATKFRNSTAKQSQKAAANTKHIAKGIKTIVINALKYGIGKKVAVAVIAIGLLIALFVSASSYMSMFVGGFNTILMTSYVAEDEDILGADGDYFAMADALAARIGRIETDYPGYDEYRYFLDVFGHDPYVLASYLTAKFLMYTRAQVQAELAELFALQYELTLTPIVEIRTRTETRTETITETDPGTGEEVEVEIETETVVEYEYHILEVTLRNRSLDMVVFSRMTPEELEMYRVYMETQGNRPELFADHPHAARREYLRYEIPPEALEDEQFARMIAEAEKFLGWPYVWGGSSPETSFDCSGYVSWVINSTGWNVGRLGALGLYNICTIISPSDARPGDLIFFNHTYAAPQPHLATHVGIYAGGGMMIHAGNPISYVSIHTPYWTRHFMAFGRLP